MLQRLALQLRNVSDQCDSSSPPSSDQCKEGTGAASTPPYWLRPGHERTLNERTQASVLSCLGMLYNNKGNFNDIIYKSLSSL